ncbi:MAG: PhoX family phosphatase [Burkholderiales bacterium]|nr:MAG: PhoX family phosphatase [Burkholderiales bacterium]
MTIHDDAVTNPSNGPHLNDLVDARIEDAGRRGLLRGSLGLSAMSFLGGATGLLAGCGSDDSPAPTAVAGTTQTAPAALARPSALGFTPVAKSVADSVSVTAGYTATPIFRLGDPMTAATTAYKNDGTDPAASFATRAGDHHDGMHFFPLDANGQRSTTASDRGLLVINHEAITPAFLHPAGQTITGTGNAAVRTSAEEVLREYYVHGVAVVEVRRAANGTWSYVQNSSFNRRIHTLTDIVLAGPAGRTALMATKYSPDGSRTRGTLNNCGNGYTPWGTYLTAEENWAGYFRRIAAVDDPKRNAKEKAQNARYGVAGTGRELWATVTPDTGDDLYGRWNAEVRAGTPAGDYRFAPHTYGWIVEIDPYAPTSPVKKRTALGRFAHEGAWPAKAVVGKPVVFYMGCDSRNEYIYKFVSARNWDAADANGGIAAGDKYMDDGKLYVARFNADGTGTWLELKFGTGPLTAANTNYSFSDQADVLINARIAADAVGATKMDRPEWGAVDPVTGAVYMTLTNSNASSRTLASTDAANPRHYNDVKGTSTNQFGNPNGHIVRWLEPNGDTSATTFAWDIFLFGARATANAANVNLSGLTAENDFSSPDGLWFSNKGVCWIQTDDGAYTDVTNCMLLAALPGTVGDGTTKTVTNTDATGATKQVTTRVGAAPGTAKLRRFLVGPKDCEITGLAETPDGQTLFINIQHPGEDTPNSAIGTPSAYTSHWPDGGLSRPRSATLAITKNGGGVVGL